jgi:hypothetical protein
MSGVTGCYQLSLPSCLRHMGVYALLCVDAFSTAAALPTELPEGCHHRVLFSVELTSLLGNYTNCAVGAAWCCAALLPCSKLPCCAAG